MARWRPDILIPLGLLALLGIGVGLWWQSFTAPPALIQGTVDPVALHAADPTRQWWSARTAVPAVDVAALPPYTFADPATGTLVPRLGQLWETVRDYERARLRALPQQTEASPVSAEVTAAIRDLAADYARFSTELANANAETYARAIDDFWPAYHRWHVYDGLSGETRRRALQTTNRTQVTPAYLNAVDAIAREYQRRSWAAEVRWQATEAALQEQLRARDAAFVADWNTTLDARVLALETEIAAAQSPASPLPAPALLESAPPVGDSKLSPVFNALTREHRAEIGEAKPAADLLQPSPAEASAAATVWADYEALLELRTQAALAAQGIDPVDGGDTDVTTDLEERLFPGAEANS